MAVYLLTPLADNAEQAATVVREHLDKGDTYQLPDKRGWLIFYRGTSIELCNLLGITGLPPGNPAKLSSVLVTAVGSYYGRAGADLWEWLKVRFENA